MVVHCMSCIFGNLVIPHRYILAFMTFAAIVNCFNHRICLHIAITEMAEKVASSVSGKDDSCPGNEIGVHLNISGGAYKWTEFQQGMILLSFYPGYLITHLPGGLLADAFGGKYVLLLCVFISTIFTFITPVAIYVTDWIGLCVVRFIVGFSQGPLFPAITTLISHWIPKNERSTIGGFVYSGIQLGTVVASIFSGFMIAISEQWPITFYVWGSFSLAWCIAFIFLCYSTPDEHPHISAEEKAYLEETIGPAQKFKIPWKPMLKDMALWSLIIAQTGHDFVNYLYVTDLPKFVKSVLKFDVGKNGAVLGVAFFLMWICSIIAGSIADYLTNREKLSVGSIRKLYAFIGASLPAMSSVLATYVGCDRTTVVACIWIGMTFMGTWFPGPKLNNLDISRHFSGVGMSLSNGFGVLSGIAAPYLVAVICLDGTLPQWQIVFWIAFAISLSTTILFMIWGKGERRPWDYVAGDE